jgi:uncharacterized phiE125 gp8 family phage protein
MSWELSLKPVRTVAPTETPVTLVEAKAHLRVDHSDDDTVLQIYLDAVTAYLDGLSGILGRAMVTQTWRQDFEAWPCNQLRLPLAPVSAISSISYYDANNASQTLTASGNYALFDDERSPAAVWLSTAVLPVLYDREDAIRVTFVAGYGAASAVPAAIKAAMLLMIADLYENRKTVIVGQTVAMTTAAKSLLAPFGRGIF